MKDEEAINWLRKRIGNLMGCKMEDMNNAYRLAIKALEERQAMREQEKPERK